MSLEAFLTDIYVREAEASEEMDDHWDYTQDLRIREAVEGTSDDIEMSED